MIVPADRGNQTGSGKTNVTDRAGNDEDPDVVEDLLFDVGGVAYRRSHRRPDVELSLAYQRLPRMGRTGAASGACAVVPAVPSTPGTPGAPGVSCATCAAGVSGCWTAAATGAASKAIGLLNAMPMWYCSTPFLLTFATELRATRPSMVAGE